FNHDVIVAQLSAVRPGLKLSRIIVAAALIIESGGRDRGDSLLLRNVPKTISQSFDVLIFNVKSINLQGNLPRLCKSRAHQVVFGISTSKWTGDRAGF